MSGGGIIIEKANMRLDSGIDVVRYHVMTEYRPGLFDESYVYAEPANEEPKIRDSIMWGGEQIIYFGANGSKRLKKVGYSFSPKCARQ